MSETAIVIDSEEVSWACWKYLCLKCGADPFKTNQLCLHVTRSVAHGFQKPPKGE